MISPQFLSGKQQLPDHSITRSLDHQITRSPDILPPHAVSRDHVARPLVVLTTHTGWKNHPVRSLVYGEPFLSRKGEADESGSDPRLAWSQRPHHRCRGNREGDGCDRRRDLGSNVVAGFERRPEPRADEQGRHDRGQRAARDDDRRVSQQQLRRERHRISR